MTEQDLQEIRERLDSMIYYNAKNLSILLNQDIPKLLSEVERLNEQHEGNMEALQGWHDDYQKLKQENERLSSDYDVLYKQAMESASNYERWEKEMKHENQRLRHALEGVKDITKKDGAWTTGAKAHYIAHRALEGAD